jgi:hypothetical protein
MNTGNGKGFIGTLDRTEAQAAEMKEREAWPALL